MQGMDRVTGAKLSGLDHVKQSITDILTTRIGTRVMRRDYGSRLPELVDRPMNAELTVDLYAETAQAIDRWEPRFRLDTVTISATAPGSITLDLTGTYLPDGEAVRLEGIVIE